MRGRAAVAEKIGFLDWLNVKEQIIATVHEPFSLVTDRKLRKRKRVKEVLERTLDREREG